LLHDMVHRAMQQKRLTPLLHGAARLVERLPLSRGAMGSDRFAPLTRPTVEIP
jgi:hypothetical protein